MLIIWCTRQNEIAARGCDEHAPNVSCTVRAMNITQPGRCMASCQYYFVPIECALFSLYIAARLFLLAFYRLFLLTSWCFLSFLFFSSVFFLFYLQHLNQSANIEETFNIHVTATKIKNQTTQGTWKQREKTINMETIIEKKNTE